MASCCGRSQRETKQLIQRLDRERFLKKQKRKILLLGPSCSGKSTFYKQASWMSERSRLYILFDGYTRSAEINDIPLSIIRICLSFHEDITQFILQEDDRARDKQNVQDCVLYQMAQLVDTCVERAETHYNDGHNIDYAFNGKLQSAADTINHYCGGSLLGEDDLERIGKAVKRLWGSDAIKHVFKTFEHVHVVDSAAYFFDDIDRIVAPNYIPTLNDLLLTRTRTTGICFNEVKSDERIFEMVDTGGEKSERSKWIMAFGSTHCVLFFVDLNCFDLNLFEKAHINAMKESVNLWECVVNNRYFSWQPMVLLFTKMDLFEKKIKNKSLRDYFSDYHGPDNDRDAAFEYVKELYLSRIFDKNRQVMTRILVAIDEDSSLGALNDILDFTVVNSLESQGCL